MRRSTLRLYAPFIALAVLQAGIVAFAPSRGEQTQDLFAAAPGAPGNAAASFDQGASPGVGAVDPATGAAVTSGPAAATAPGGAATAGGTSGVRSPAPGGTTAAPAHGAVSGSGSAGDTSHCKNGRQTDVIFNAPPCAPKFVGDNGGPSYPGVTATEIKVIYFECQPNEQVNAILATQGLAASRAETDAMIQAVVDFINKNYELSGRKIAWEHVIGDCPLTPPDPAKSRQAAAEVAKKKPFMVVHYASGPETHDVWRQNGIMSLGGPNGDNSFFAGRRPFHWDVFPSGTEAADVVAEYYCKKLAGKPATNGGQIIHAPDMNRSTKRKLGILIPDNGNGYQLPNAARVAEKVKACTNGAENPADTTFTYASDINRAEEQSSVIVAGLISKKVTTVVCICDLISPVFMTNQMSRNGYYPEHLLPSSNLLDYDVLGRLYDPVQWNHAFGPSQLVKPVPFEQSDAARIWRAAGRSGLPCASCNLVTGYFTLVGSMLHAGGPRLDPGSVERALVGGNYKRGGWAETKGDPGIYLIKFGPNDYNAISDVREVYWDRNATSAIDGKQGAYVDVNGGRRYATGEMTGDFTIAPKPE